MCVWGKETPTQLGVTGRASTSVFLSVLQTWVVLTRKGIWALSPFNVWTFVSRNKLWYSPFFLLWSQTVYFSTNVNITHWGPFQDRTRETDPFHGDPLPHEGNSPEHTQSSHHGWETCTGTHFSSGWIASVLKGPFPFCPPGLMRNRNPVGAGARSTLRRCEGGDVGKKGYQDLGLCSSTIFP